MASSVRVPQVEVTGLFGAAIKAFSKRLVGQVPDSLGVMWNNPRVLRALMGLSTQAERWKRCDAQLKSLAHMATAAVVGCSFCLDLQYFLAHNNDLDIDKARDVPRWRQSNLFTPLERDVMAYAEAMTQTPPTVTDEMSARLLDAIGAAALVELTAFIAAANLASRTNVALGIEAQGFAEACGLRPLATRSAA